MRQVRQRRLDEGRPPFTPTTKHQSQQFLSCQVLHLKTDFSSEMTLRIRSLKEEDG